MISVRRRLEGSLGFSSTKWRFRVDGLAFCFNWLKFKCELKWHCNHKLTHKVLEKEDSRIRYCRNLQLLLQNYLWLLYLYHQWTYLDLYRSLFPFPSLQVGPNCGKVEIYKFMKCRRLRIIRHLSKGKRIWLTKVNNPGSARLAFRTINKNRRWR